jgi:hypothetical protein
MKSPSSSAAGSISDPLIDEVRLARQELCARFGNDIEKLCDHLRQIEKKYEARLRRQPQSQDRAREV